jgi:hypothetical protein
MMDDNDNRGADNVRSKLVAACRHGTEPSRQVRGELEFRKQIANEMIAIANSGMAALPDQVRFVIEDALVEAVFCLYCQVRLHVSLAQGLLDPNEPPDTVEREQIEKFYRPTSVELLNDVAKAVLTGDRHPFNSR